MRRVIVAAGLILVPLLVFQVVPVVPTNTAELGSEPLAIYESPRPAASTQGYPELFAELHHSIRASEDGTVRYPMGYQIREFQKAVAARKGSGGRLNWTERGPGNVGGRTRPIVVDPDDPNYNTWFAGTVGGGLWWTQDRGQSWGYLTDQLPSLAVSALAMAESDRNILYMGTGEGFYNMDAVMGVGVFKSYDRGQTWEHLLATASDSRFRYVNSLVIDPSNADVVVAATNQGLYRTTDGGMAWTEVHASGGRVQDLRAQPGNFSTLIAGENPGGILHSVDGGATWRYAITSKEIIGGNGRIELTYSTHDPSVAYAGVQAGHGGSGLLRSDDGGASWVNTIDGTVRGHLDWLDGQGWYDNTLAVHPFSVDTVLLGGVWLWRTKMSADRVDVMEPTGFAAALWDQPDGIVSYVDALGHFFGSEGVVFVGFLGGGFTDISAAENSSVEIRYGQGTQMAHRFHSDDSAVQGGDCFSLPYDRNEYQDYVEVPFTAWDIDSGRQLAVSFRDNANDSTFNLISLTTSGPCEMLSNEQVFVHKYDYDASSPYDSLAQDGGLTRGMMYMVLPVLQDSSMVWDPASVPVQTTRITYVYATGLLARTTDKNIDPAWEVHVDHHGIVPIGIDEASNDFWILNTNDGGVALSTDGGKIFREADASFAGFNTSQFYGVDKMPGASRYVGGTQDNGCLVSFGNANNRRGWMQLDIFACGDGFEALWHTRDASRIITSSYFNILLYSDNGGGSWHTVSNLPDIGIFATSLDHAPNAPDTVYVIGLQGVWRSADWLETWQLAAIDSAWSPTNLGKVRASLATDSVVWAGYGLDSDPARTLWVSTDAGETYSPADLPTIANPPETITSGLATHPSEAGTAYALFSRDKRPKILRTADFGHTWEDISGFSESTSGASVRGFPDVAVYDLLVMPHAPHVMWAGTEIGLFQTKSYGREWNYAHNGLPAVAVWRMKLRDDEIVVATHGRGVWTVPWAQIDVSVEDDVRAELPESFSLEQNYPNPFNPTTTVTFSVPDQARVRLTVYDVAGRKVATLTDQDYAPGVHRIVWDASALASGIYFCRMEAAGNLIHTQKMTLVK